MLKNIDWRGQNHKKTDKETARILSNFFSNLVKNLDIQQFNVNDPICENINDLSLESIVKNRSDPSIIAVKQKCNY